MLRPDNVVEQNAQPSYVERKFDKYEKYNKKKTEKAQKRSEQFYKNGFGALMRAVQKSDSPLVKKLLDKGIDLKQVDNIGYTALVIASQNGYEAAANLLNATIANEDSKYASAPLSQEIDVAHNIQQDERSNYGAEDQNPDYQSGYINIMGEYADSNPAS